MKGHTLTASRHYAPCLLTHGGPDDSPCSSDADAVQRWFAIVPGGGRPVKTRDPADPRVPKLISHVSRCNTCLGRDRIRDCAGHARLWRVRCPTDPSFGAVADAVSELLDHLSIGARYIYLHDFGAPVGLRIAMAEPHLVSGLIVQNANAHHSGLGPQWAETKAFWANPSKENEEQATAHLTLDGTRDQYTAGLPESIAARISSDSWEEDWCVMQLPGRLATQRALIADYGNYVSQFDTIAHYLEEFCPPAIMIWGRHDPFFDLSEIISWLNALPRMQAHILDAGHFALETEAPRAARFIADFITRR